MRISLTGSPLDTVISAGRNLYLFACTVMVRTLSAAGAGKAMAKIPRKIVNIVFRIAITKSRSCFLSYRSHAALLDGQAYGRISLQSGHRSGDIERIDTGRRD